MRKSFYKSIGIFLFSALCSAAVSAQGAQIQIAQKRDSEGISMWWYILIVVLATALAVVLYEFFKNKKSARETARKEDSKRRFEKKDALEINADRELEWAKNKSKNRLKKTRKKVAKIASHTLSDADIKAKLLEISEKKVPEKETLPPVFEITELESARQFEPLPVSTDEFLLDAIEQVHEEFEEDLEARELALKILAAHRTQNSVEAVSQVALYDLSSALRARAVLLLADYDHESVFETILLACADPTREVRAAAARALFRLSFDRQQAWLRVSEFEDTGRLRLCARALAASDLVERSLERLTHPDINYAAEAFAVAALLIKANETEKIFDFLANHPDLLRQKAVVHAIKITDEPHALEKLAELRETVEIPDEICVEIDAILEFSEVLLVNE